MTAGEADAARRVGERLSAELGELIRSMPIERRTVTAMSRWLDITRPICQRVVQAARHRGDPLEVLTRLPGVQGLASFVRAARDAACDAGAVDAVEAATTAYTNLIDRHGGSQSRLIAAIEHRLREQADSRPAAPDTEPPADGPTAARRRIFEGATAITGREYGAQVGVFLYAPTPGKADRIDCITAMGLLDVRTRDGAMPICPISTFAYGRPDDSPDELPVRPVTETEGSPLPVGRVEPFCSTPPPEIIARRRGGRVSVLIEPDRTAPGPVDVMLAARFLGVPHPALDDPKMQTCFVHCDGPARRLLIAVHLHRSIAMRSVAMAGAYIRDRVAARIPGPDGHAHVLTPQELWADRLPDVPSLEYLGLGLEQADAPAYARQRELVSHLMDLQAWDPDEFVGYRIQVEYPVWNAQYVVHFDFPDEEDGEGEG
jgi:hypothetical protein